jgi:hypothetical protein
MNYYTQLSLREKTQESCKRNYKFIARYMFIEREREREREREFIFE